ncbi:MAG: L-seryl-tRNA(Sec) selenium transferase [Oscillospiraceae bacterium]|nr:L-seryl-tRNA(Sec) selenium transferase [Oscillospiraceae bacterium]MBR3949585.1 L-seryl-tRNA(Sec) selenium transferase [Oscillospiraceae bacterium]
MKEQLLRSLPKVDILCQAPALKEERETYGEKAVTEAVRQEIATLRQEILAGTRSSLPAEEVLFRQLQERMIRNALPSLRNVINGTGIILHTNLGRACLSEKAAQAAADAARRYSNLEYDIPNGRRGTRYAHIEELLCRLTGAESVLVVNNNAAAVLLVLSALTQGGQVIVSRGELVEIGGSFRVPEIMEACGAQLKEVGTTNKTHLSDYARAIGPETKALMKVHTSNYRIVGFSETPALADLVKLGHDRGLPVLEDLGSGCLIDLANYGIHGEPSVQDSLKAGADIVSFSGDKLLGGPQAGIILGRKQYIDILKKHPLTRAMRVDKMTLAALEATLSSYAQDRLEEIPVVNMLSASADTLNAKAEKLAALLRQAGIPVSVVPVQGQVGGGSVPTQSLPSFAVALSGSVISLEEKLRLGIHPIIGRIHNDTYLLDVRTLWEEDFPIIAEAVKEAMA